jgi:hypothetical protein
MFRMIRFEACLQGCDSCVVCYICTDVPEEPAAAIIRADEIITIYSSVLTVEVGGFSEMLACLPTTQHHISQLCRYKYSVRN